MTFWIDAQLDPQLAVWLGSRFGVFAKHLIEIGLADADDEVLWAAGKRFREIVILSKDNDFAEFSRCRGSPPQVLHLRCGNLSTIWVQALLTRTFAEALAKLERGDALVEILGP